MKTTVSRTHNPAPVTHNRVLADAQRVLVGGVNSPVRAFRQIGAEPLILVRGRGADVVDAARRRYVDFIMGWGCLILGHSHPVVVRAIRAALRADVMTGLTHPAEIELARLITEAVPSVEQVRFTTSGTEACMTAVRLARACTGRTKVLMFDGGYHGHSDALLARNSAGIPELTAQETVSVPFNDPEALTDAVRRCGADVACAIIEPVAANIGVVPPQPGYLAHLRHLTRLNGILLIFDEVVTGFRLGLAGAQGLFGITPDLTVFGKIIGGGLPIGALGGPRPLMQRLAPAGDVFHGGTFAGHPLSMAAGAAVLKSLKSQPPYEQIERLAERLAEGLSQAAERAGVPVVANRVGSMLTLFFSDGPVQQAAQAKGSRRELFAAWAAGWLERGILWPPSPYEAAFLSLAHTDAHVDRALEAAAAAFARMR